MSDQLNIAAAAVAQRLQDAISYARESGQHPRGESLSLQDGFDLAIVLGQCAVELAAVQKQLTNGDPA